MATMTLTSKGQMTLPKAIRDDLKLQPGDKIEVEKRNGEYVLKPRNRSATELFGMLKRPGQKPLTIDEMDEAIAEEVWERNRPSRDRR